MTNVIKFQTPRDKFKQKITESWNKMKQASADATAEHRKQTRAFEQQFPGQASRAYILGRHAAMIGQDETHNPYSEKRSDGRIHPQHRDWARGWKEYTEGIPDPTGRSK